MEIPKPLKAYKMMATNNGSMFEDVVIEILSKLPVKSLLRLRCVCKCWYELFGSPSFISKHQKNEHNTRLVVHYVAWDEDENYECERICLFHDGTLADVCLQEQILPLLPEKEEYPRGPFECGVFCFTIRHIQEISLWSLTTRDHKILPQLNLGSFWEIFCVGLGLDHESNYKLVCTMTTFQLDQNGNQKSSESNQVAIYSFSTNSWRNFQCLELGKYEFGFGDTFNGMYQNGVCYWLAKDHLKTKQLRMEQNTPHSEYFDHKVILSFDMSNEVFQEIQTPDCHFESPKTNQQHKAFGVHNGSLYYLKFDDKKICFDTWMTNKESHNYN